MVSMRKVEGCPIPIVGREKCQCFSDFKVYIWFFCGAAHLGPQATNTPPLYTLKYWHNYLLFFIHTYMHPEPPHFWQVYIHLTHGEHQFCYSVKIFADSPLKIYQSRYCLLLINTFSPCKVGRINPLNLNISMYTLHTASLFPRNWRELRPFVVDDNFSSP